MPVPDFPTDSLIRFTLLSLGIVVALAVFWQLWRWSRWRPLAWVVGLLGVALFCTGSLAFGYALPFLIMALLGLLVVGAALLVVWLVLLAAKSA